MKRIFTFLFFIPSVLSAQLINYTPNRKLDKTVAKTYYNTEFIYLTNLSNKSFDVEYTVIENTLDAGWSAALCTNTKCSNNIPKSGSLGTLSPTAEAFISVSVSANETLGEGQVRFLITSKQQSSLSDTVTFRYTVNEDGTVQAGPWAKINVANGVLNVLLQNPGNNVMLYVFNIHGNAVYNGAVDGIASVPLRDYAKGLYFVMITDETGREIKQKVVYF